MNSMNITPLISSMLSGDEIIKELSIMPPYNESIRIANQATRLINLSQLYHIYIPSQMSLDIYNKLYLSLLHSIKKKESHIAIRQHYENFKGIMQEESNGIIGGSDSFSIIGVSGIGKSSAINRAISVISKNKIIETKDTFSKIVPYLVVQCPFDSSVKGLLLEILRKIDELLGSKFYENALKRQPSTDTLIGAVSQVALNHIGVLVVDEIQNVANNKNGKKLIGSLTQLINNSGISICMVGTPDSIIFFQQAMQLARRSLGLQYNTLEYSVYFKNFCKTIFEYQYVTKKSHINDMIIEWLYEHSAGIISIVVSLIHDAQEIAIITGKEVLNLEVLNEAYQNRLCMLHEYIRPNTVKIIQSTKRRKKVTSNVCKIKNENIDIKSISELKYQSEIENLNFIELLKTQFSVTEVGI